MPTKEYNATITERTEVAPGLMIVRVALDEPNLTFQAGQYNVLGLKYSAPRVPEAADEELDPERHRPEKMILRAYSIASSSKPSENFLEYYVTLVTSGALTPRLFALKPEDRLYVGPKATGWFTLDRVPEDANVMFLATGTGLAPYMSILRSNSICESPRNFVVLQGARYSWDLGYRTELSALAKTCGNFTYVPVVSLPDEDKSWAGPTGFLQDIMLSGLIEIETGLEVDPKDFHIFLCGNPLMVEAAKEKLVARGFTPDKGRETGNLHMEEYW